VEWLRDGYVRAVVDDWIIDEYTDVLGRPTFGLPQSEVQIVLQFIRRRGQWGHHPAWDDGRRVAGPG